MDRSERRHRQDLPAGHAVLAPGDRGRLARGQPARGDLHRGGDAGTARAPARAPGAGARSRSRRCRRRRRRSATTDDAPGRIRNRTRRPGLPAAPAAPGGGSDGRRSDLHHPWFLPARPGRPCDRSRTALGAAGHRRKRDRPARGSRDGFLAPLQYRCGENGEPAPLVEIAAGAGEGSAGTAGDRCAAAFAAGRNPPATGGRRSAT